MPHFHIVTLFPQFFDSPLQTGMLARARERGLLTFSFHNPRDFSQDRHGRVDDAPYGGGPGMVMAVQPVASALERIGNPGKMICLSPAGRPLTAAFAASLAMEANLTLICGRYEGLDARLLKLFPMDEVSVGDAVLNGGETAALAVIESVSRFVPGFLGKDDSAADESFADGLLEYPQFTRPKNAAGLETPEILLSGHHARIAAWRRCQALARTLRTRPQMLNEAPLTQKDAAALAEMPLQRPGRNLGFCLFHYPVRLEKGRIGVSSLTNLDIHDIARISRSYGMGTFYALTPLEDQLALLRAILSHWLDGPATDRSRALRLVQPVASFEEMDKLAFAAHGAAPFYLAASAHWPKGKGPALTPGAVRGILRDRPVIICLGTARGLAPEVIDRCEGQLRPLRFLSDNHLSVRSAAAIIADRILGDFC